MQLRGLPREARLKDRRAFLRLRMEGHRVVRPYFVANWMASPPGVVGRIGLITTRKLGPSVVRSRARRLLREAYRMVRADMVGPVTLILVARPGILKAGGAEVFGELRATLGRAGLLKSGT